MQKETSLLCNLCLLEEQEVLALTWETSLKIQPVSWVQRLEPVLLLEESLVQLTVVPKLEIVSVLQQHT